jgi:hypothetical protein
MSQKIYFLHLITLDFSVIFLNVFQGKGKAIVSDCQYY